MKYYATPDLAYSGVLIELLYGTKTVESKPRGLPISELLGHQFTVENPSSAPIVTRDQERNVIIAAYTAKEFALYDRMTNSCEDFAAAAKFWGKLANPDGTINSAYGWLVHGRKICGNRAYEMDRMRSPWEWARMALTDDKDTRQAIIHFSTPDHAWRGVKDFTCTLAGQFMIRHNKLHFIITMRSNDVVRGLVYDLPWFCSLQERMVNELLPIYPNLVVGRYTHQAGSMHVYHKDLEMARKMLVESAPTTA